MRHAGQRGHVHIDHGLRAIPVAVFKEAMIALSCDVDEFVELATELPDFVEQTRRILWIRQVNRQALDLQSRPGDLLAKGLEPVCAPGGEDQAPRAGSQLPGKLCAEPRGSAGDENSGLVENR